ncbi:unnamed protein product [Lymnaea stagnalis]|uniref:G-protein coupled receptors family 1 profile domain-containing protein n=1 Tax=Lymnaea stagnalis TaxID=6523 RepID=A0AAV2H2Z3_LYMST
MRRPTVEELGCLVYNTTAGRLMCLNDVKARLYLPVTIFLAVLIVIGTIGNATVCLVYCNRKSRVSSHYFILYLAALDLVTCVIGMPTEIADLVLPYTFESPWACKVLRFTHSSTIIASSTILIEVAFDRYYRICQLGRQFTANKSRFLCVGAVVLGLVCSWPTFLLFGRKTVTRNLNGNILKGSDCSTDDSMRRTIYPTIYYVFLFSLFGITVIFFAVLYSKIGLTILGRKRMHMGSVNSNTSSSKGLLRSGSKKENSHVSDPTSSDLSTEQDEGQGGASTASGNSNNSIMSSSTSTTTISGSYSSIKRHGKKARPLEDPQKWHHPDPTCRTASTPCIDSANNIYTGSDTEDLPSNGAAPITNLEMVQQNSPSPVIRISHSLTASEKCPAIALVGGTIPAIALAGGAILTRTPSRKNSRTRFFYRHFQQNHHQVDTTDDEGNTTDGQKTQARTTPRSSARQIRVGKTTTVLFAVTLAYILSFLPYLTVMVLRSIIRDLEENLSPVGELAYKLCVKSFFINNAINPLIYSFLNQTFRQDAKLMIIKCYGGPRRPAGSRPRVVSPPNVV